MTAAERLAVIPQPAERPTVILPRGYPGAGKTTLYKRLQVDGRSLARVSRDDARMMLFGVATDLSFRQEQSITRAERAQAAALLDAGMSVYVDAMHLRARWARQWADFAAVHGADFQVIDLDTPVDECVRRDAERGAAGGRMVGEKVIRGLAKKYPRKSWPEIVASPDLFFYPMPYEPDGSLPQAWICDIDGTLARMTGRNPYDFTRVHEDAPIAHMVTVLRKLAEDSVIVLLSGRDESSRSVTESWLRDNAIPFSELHMRADEDGRPDYLMKYELFDQRIRGRFHVLGVFDDRLSVCRMWDRLGVPLMRLGRPDQDDF